MATACPTECKAQAGKYLSFELAGREYGLEILKVQEIKSLSATIHVPGMPDYMRGVVNLRGRIIPALDLRHRFGLPDCADPEHRCLIIVQVGVAGADHRIGLIVDSVSDVLNLQDEQIDAEAEPGMFDAPLDCLAGHGHPDRRSVALLDLDVVFGAEDLALITEAVA